MCVDHKLFIRASASVLILFFLFHFFFCTSLCFDFYIRLFSYFSWNLYPSMLWVRIRCHSVYCVLCMVLAMVRASLVWQIGFRVSRCLRTQHNLIWVAVFTLISTFFFFCHYFILILFRFRRCSRCVCDSVSWFVWFLLSYVALKIHFFRLSCCGINMVITCKIIQKWH